MELLIDNRQDMLEIDDKTTQKIEKVIEECLKFENRDLGVEVSLSLVNNEEIKGLNKIYRNIDSETDVLSFPLEEEFFIEEQLPLLGDIVISTEKVISQAEEFNHSIERELLYLVVHSMFHLLGYDHMTDEEKIIMRDKEKEIMKKINIFKNN